MIRHIFFALVTLGGGYASAVEGGTNAGGAGGGSKPISLVALCENRIELLKGAVDKSLERAAYANYKDANDLLSQAFQEALELSKKEGDTKSLFYKSLEWGIKLEELLTSREVSEEFTAKEVYLLFVSLIEFIEIHVLPLDVRNHLNCNLNSDMAFELRIPFYYSVVLRWLNERFVIALGLDGHSVSSAKVYFRIALTILDRLIVDLDDECSLLREAHRSFVVGAKHIAQDLTQYLAGNTRLNLQEASLKIYAKLEKLSRDLNFSEFHQCCDFSPKRKKE